MRNISNYEIAFIPAVFSLNESPDSPVRSSGDLIACLKQKRIQAEQGKKEWITGNKAVTCTLAGSRTVAELEANVKAATGTITNDITDSLNRITRPLTEKQGNHIDYCESAEHDRTI